MVKAARLEFFWDQCVFGWDDFFLQPHWALEIENLWFRMVGIVEQSRIQRHSNTYMKRSWKIESISTWLRIGRALRHGDIWGSLDASIKLGLRMASIVLRILEILDWVCEALNCTELSIFIVRVGIFLSIFKNCQSLAVNFSSVAILMIFDVGAIEDHVILGILIHFWGGPEKKMPLVAIPNVDA